MGQLLENGSFFGTATSHRIVAGVTLTEGRYASRARIPPHAHRSPYLCVVLHGEFEELSAGRRETCGPGTVVFHPAEEEHADHMGAMGARCFNLQLGFKLAAQLEATSALPGSRAALPPGRITALAVSLRRPSTSLTALVVEGALLDILAELPSRDTARIQVRPKPRWLDRAMEQLRLADPPSVTELAEDAGVHPVYFARAFRAATRFAPTAFAIRARLERASRALLTSGASVSAVAHAAGFADHSHFCRQFHRAFGVTPSVYRAGFR
jgi:AraC family transcriptional regulator